MTRLRFGWLQLFLGCALGVFAESIGGLARVLYWPAQAVFVIALAYLGLGPRVFGKRMDGSIPLLHAVWLLPYHVVAWLRLHYDSVLNDEPAWNRIDGDLTLGRRTRGTLPEGTELVVDLMAELPRIPFDAARIGYVLIPTLDATEPDEHAVVEALLALRRQRRPTYVHCAAGHGRSATFVAAWLVLEGVAHDANSAEAWIRRERPRVHLKREQRALVDRIALQRDALVARSRA